MNEQSIEDLKNALREVVSMVTQRGQPLTNDLKVMLSQVMEHVATRIQQLRSEGQETSVENQGKSQLESQVDEVREQIQPSSESIPLDQQVNQGQVPDQTPPSPPNVPIKMSRGMPSSNVHSFAYDHNKGNLYVRFQDKWPYQNGPVYKYSNVEPEIFDLFKIGSIAPKTSGKNAWHEWKKGVAPSLGASLNLLLKNGGYSYTKLS